MASKSDLLALKSDFVEFKKDVALKKRSDNIKG